jgi:hypothetical protein
MNEPQLADAIITATQVAPENRLNTLPTFFPKNYMQFENIVYTVMDKICGNYTGGFWEFYELSNGGFYMAPDMTEPCVISVPFGNGYEGNMSAEAVGITACIYAYCFLSETDPAMADHHWSLRDFANNHAEAGEIWRAID